MKLRAGPIAAVILLSGLGLYAWRTEFHGSAERKKAEESRDRALPFERDTLQAFTLAHAGESIRVQKEGDGWVITEPAAGPAEKEAVEGILSSLEFARIERRLGPDVDRKEVGLDPPPLKVAIEVAGKPERAILLGQTSPIGGAYYAVLEDGKEIGLVSASVGEAAQRDLFSLRDKSLIAFDPWKTHSVTLERGRDLIALEKKEAGGWTLTRPIEAPADGPTITEMLNALERLRAAKFIAETATPEVLEDCGLEPPQARLAVTQEGWDAARIVAFGGEKEGLRCVRPPGRDVVVGITSDFWPKLTTPVGDLRRRELVGLSQYRLTKISVLRADGPEVTLTRGTEGRWDLTGPVGGSVKSESVDNLGRALAGIKAIGFDDAPAPALVAAIRAKPAFDLTLEQEPDAEGGKPATQHLLFGAPGRDGRRPVRDRDWGYVAWVDGSALAAIERQLEDLVKEASTPPAPPPPAGGDAAAPGAGPGTAPEAGAPAADDQPAEPPG